LIVIQPGETNNVELYENMFHLKSSDNVSTRTS